MVSNSFGALGALTLLSNYQRYNQLGGGTLQAIGGMQNASNDTASQIRLTIAEAEQKARNTQIASSMVKRFRGIAEGLIEPDPDRQFEQVGGFLTITGQPFIMSVNAQGQVDVQAQKEIVRSPLYSQAQIVGLQNATARLEELIDQENLNNTKANLAATLALAAEQTEKLINFYPASEVWEFGFNAQRHMGIPTKLSLDSAGNVITLNQFEHDFAEVENNLDRQKLLQAARDLNNIYSGAKSATETWQYEAIGKKATNEDFFLDLDSQGNIITVNNREKSSSLSSTLPGYLDSIINPISKSFDRLAIIPDFLRDRPALSFNEKWEEDAIALYKDKKPFYLDPIGASYKARELTFSAVNIMSQRLDNSFDFSLRSSLVNLLA